MVFSKKRQCHPSLLVCNQIFYGWFGYAEVVLMITPFFVKIAFSYNTEQKCTWWMGFLRSFRESTPAGAEGWGVLQQSLLSFVVVWWQTTRRKPLWWARTWGPAIIISIMHKDMTRSNVFSRVDITFVMETSGQAIWVPPVLLFLNISWSEGLSVEVVITMKMV